MKLWVRSQDRMNLIEVHQVRLHYGNNIQIIANCKPEYFDGGGEDYELLGVYSSRERALEVLDDIQSKMVINLKANSISYDQADIMIKSEMLGKMVYVYDMPKE